jgi:hypothetical protein
MARGNKSSKAVVAQRQKKAVDLAKAGFSQKDIAGELGVDRVTIYRNLKELTEKFQTENSAAFEEFKRAQLEVFELMERSLIEGKVSVDVAREWRGIRSEISSLLGLNAPTKSITAHIRTDGTGRFHKFVQSAAGLSDAQMEQVFQFAASLEREPLPMPAGPPPLMLESGPVTEEKQ